MRPEVRKLLEDGLAATRRSIGQTDELLGQAKANVADCEEKLASLRATEAEIKKLCPPIKADEPIE